MAPATMTEVLLVEQPHNEDCRECNCRHESNNNKPNHNNNIELVYKANVYDQTRPKNEPKFMNPIREWEKQMGFVTAIRWFNVVLISLFHIIVIGTSFYYPMNIESPKWQTVLFGFFMGELVGFGVTAGAHRYWCHRSYKAKLPLQIILMICYAAAGQIKIYNWVRDHRVHHKFSETSADPHDARRGLFFSHVGWLMMKKHPDVLREGDKVDMSDIANDPLFRFHTTYFMIFKLLCCFVIPMLIPVYGWGETLCMGILSQLLRYVFNLNFTWSVNSFAHLYGNKPYDRSIMPAENWMVSIVAMGEGWHNYHHTFPWDYKAAELPYNINLTTVLLNAFAKIGWAYDMKQASPDLVRTVTKNRADSNHKKIS